MNKTTMVNESTNVKQTGGSETSDKKGKGEMQAPPQSHGSFIKSEPGLVTAKRPSNPFLKSSIK